MPQPPRISEQQPPERPGAFSLSAVPPRTQDSGHRCSTGEQRDLLHKMHRLSFTDSRLRPPLCKRQGKVHSMRAEGAMKKLLFVLLLLSIIADKNVFAEGSAEGEVTPDLKTEEY